MDRGIYPWMYGFAKCSKDIRGLREPRDTDQDKWAGQIWARNSANA